MIIVIPQDLTGDNLLSTNVINEPYAAWSSGTYNRGDRVIESDSIYEVVASGSTSEQPTIGVNSQPPSWVRLGYVNQLRMFTGARDSQSTVVAGDIDVTVKSDDDYYDFIAVLGIVGKSLTIEVTDSSNVVLQSETFDLVDIGVSDWWEYFYLPYDQIEGVVFSSIRYEQAGKIRILIEGGGGDTACGRVVLGTANKVGTTDYGTSVGLLSFTQFARDGFGQLAIRAGRTVNTASYSVSVSTPYVDSALRYIRAAGGKIAFYMGDEGREATYILGVSEEPRINYSNPSFSSLTIEVQGQ